MTITLDPTNPTGVKGVKSPSNIASNIKDIAAQQWRAGSVLLNDPGVRGGSGGGGGGGSATSAYSAPDPYAKYGGKATYDRLMAGFDRQQQNIYGTAYDAARTGGIGLRSSILDLVDSLKTGQTSIDERAINNYMAKRQGTQDITSMVGRGIRSGGVMLGNKNAVDSSASEALARAYGDIGRRQLSDVGNQFALEKRQIGLSQDDLDRQQQTGVRKIRESKSMVINNILAEARNKLGALDAAMVDADITKKINIDREKQKIKGRLVDILQQYDSMLSNRVGAINPMGEGGRISEATRLAGLGQAPENAFDFTSSAPANFQQTGASPSGLPLYALPRNREDNQGV